MQQRESKNLRLNSTSEINHPISPQPHERWELVLQILKGHIRLYKKVPQGLYIITFNWCNRGKAKRLDRTTSPNNQCSPQQISTTRRDMKTEITDHERVHSTLRMYLNAAIWFWLVQWKENKTPPEMIPHNCKSRNLYLYREESYQSSWKWYQ